jgi:hypothetical protein
MIVSITFEPRNIADVVREDTGEVIFTAASITRRHHLLGLRGTRLKGILLYSGDELLERAVQWCAQRGFTVEVVNVMDEGEDYGH